MENTAGKARFRACFLVLSLSFLRVESNCGLDQLPEDAVILCDEYFKLPVRLATSKNTVNDQLVGSVYARRAKLAQ